MNEGKKRKRKKDNKNQRHRLIEGRRGNGRGVWPESGNRRKKQKSWKGSHNIQHLRRARDNHFKTKKLNRKKLSN